MKQSDKKRPEQLAIDLPDGWRRELKIAAAKGGTTVRALVLDAIRPIVLGSDALPQATTR